MLTFIMKDAPHRSVAASVSMRAAAYDELCCGRLTRHGFGPDPLEPVSSSSLIRSLFVTTSPDAKLSRYSDRSGSEAITRTTFDSVRLKPSQIVSDTSLHNITSASVQVNMPH